MKGTWLVSGLLGFSAAFGLALWYFQTQAYYVAVELSEPAAPAAAVTAPSTLEINTNASAIAPSGEAPVPVLPGLPKLGEGAEVTALPQVDATSPEVGPAAKLLAGRITLRMTPHDRSTPVAVAADDFRGIDAPTSPLKFRACFSTIHSLAYLTETYALYDAATPLRAPGWFDCFEVERITDDLERGEALAFLGEGNIHYGIDRVVAVYPDGRAFAWHQLNDCGTAAFAGDPLPNHCPPPPSQGN